MGILAWIVVGLVAGWFASQVMRGGGYGLIGDVIVGVLGALLGGFLASTFLKHAERGKRDQLQQHHRGLRRRGDSDRHPAGHFSWRPQGVLRLRKAGQPALCRAIVPSPRSLDLAGGRPAAHTGGAETTRNPSDRRGARNMETVRHEESTEVLNTTSADVGAVYAGPRPAGGFRSYRQYEHERRVPHDDASNGKRQAATRSPCGATCPSKCRTSSTYCSGSWRGCSPSASCWGCSVPTRLRALLSSSTASRARSSRSFVGLFGQPRFEGSVFELNASVCDPRLRTALLGAGQDRMACDRRLAARHAHDIEPDRHA